MFLLGEDSGHCKLSRYLFCVITIETVNNEKNWIQNRMDVKTYRPSMDSLNMLQHFPKRVRFVDHGEVCIRIFEQPEKKHDENVTISHLKRIDFQNHGFLLWLLNCTKEKVSTVCVCKSISNISSSSGERLWTFNFISKMNELIETHENGIEKFRGVHGILA